MGNQNLIFQSLTMKSFLVICILIGTALSAANKSRNLQAGLTFEQKQNMSAALNAYIKKHGGQQHVIARRLNYFDMQPLVDKWIADHIKTKRRLHTLNPQQQMNALAKKIIAQQNN